MLDQEFFIGSRWGKLTVIERMPASFVKSGYLMRCDCGDELVRKPYQVRAMKYMMCLKCSTLARRGKPVFKNRIDPLQRTINEQWNVFRKVAKAKGDEYLSKEQWFDIVTSNCSYCGQPPSNVRKASVLYAEDFKYSGIDRVDSEIGYVEDNCIPCCWPCNRMKGNMSQMEFLGHLFSVLKYIGNDLEENREFIDKKFWRYDT